MISPETKAELAELKQWVERLQRDEITRAEFRREAGHYGVHGQAQNKLYFLRIRVPCGILSAEQLDGLAAAAQTWGDGQCHLTTRQGVEIHGLTLENVLPILKALAEIDLISHESGGSAVRNIVLCPHAGAAQGEPFDATEYADWLTRHLLRHPQYQRLPRKVKIGMACCQADCARTLAQDLGFQARLDKAQKFRGFRVVVGGGLGANPRIGQLLFEFVAAEDLLLVTDAILRVFDRHGDRQNRRRGRLKFLIESMGIAEFRRHVSEELVGLKDSPPAYPPLVFFREKGRRGGASRPQNLSGRFAFNQGAYLRWRDGCVRPQRQEALQMIEVRVAGGDFSAGHCRQLATIIRSHDLSLRITPTQGVLLRGARTDQLKEIYQALHQTGLDTLSIPVALVACPGSGGGCSNAFTNTRALMPVLRLQLKIHEDSLENLGRVNVQISGCSNGCSLHALGDIGLEGVARRHGERWVPTYRVWVGGAANEKGLQWGTRIGVVASRKIPSLISDLLSCYRKQRIGKETFAEMIRRTGVEPFRHLVEKHAADSDLHSEQLTRDWGGSQAYHPPDRSKAGTCG